MTIDERIQAFKVRFTPIGDTKEIIERILYYRVYHIGEKWYYQLLPNQNTSFSP